jgi:threonine/homoserine/homoserine lactone efflux protein
LTPGPAVLFVVSHGLARGGRASLAANAGILTANAVYFVLSALGLGAVLLASATLFTIVKYAGAAYLVYLGIQTIRGAGLGLPETGGATPEASARRTWLRATALQASNPKALIFFTALLPQFIDTTKPIAVQIAVLGVAGSVIEFVILAGYGYLAAGAARLAQQRRFRALTNRVSGAFLIAAGAGVALNRTR